MRSSYVVLSSASRRYGIDENVVERGHWTQAFNAKAYSLHEDPFC